MVRVGVSAARQSWNTMPSSLPHRARSSRAGMSTRLRPSYRMSPRVTAPADPRSPIAALISVLFPLPDSPTTPKMRPAPSVAHTSRTARNPPYETSVCSNASNGTLMSTVLPVRYVMSRSTVIS